MQKTKFWKLKRLNVGGETKEWSLEMQDGYGFTFMGYRFYMHFEKDTRRWILTDGLTGSKIFHDENKQACADFIKRPDMLLKLKAAHKQHADIMKIYDQLIFNEIEKEFKTDESKN